MRSSVLVAIYLASFLLASTAIRAALGWPEASGLRQKVEHYEADPEGFDLVFVGSSNIMCSVIPALFEEELRARGHDLRVYNLGMPGMLSFETDHLARHVLETRPERLRWMILEVTEWRPDPRMSEPTERTVYWHTFERTGAMIETARAYESFEPRDVLRFSRDHVNLALWRLANVGRVQQRAMLELGIKQHDRWYETIAPERERGFIALEESGNENAADGHERFLDGLPRYHGEVTKLRQQSRPPGPPPAHLLPGATRQLDLFEGTGVEPIHVLFATSHPTPSLLQLGGEEGIVPTLWAFNDPKAYPDLYKVRNRYDNRHLNRPGAEELTRLLAQRFADHLDAQ